MRRHTSSVDIDCISLCFSSYVQGLYDSIIHMFRFAFSKHHTHIKLQVSPLTNTSSWTYVRRAASMLAQHFGSEHHRTADHSIAQKPMTLREHCTSSFTNLITGDMHSICTAPRPCIAAWLGSKGQRTRHLAGARHSKPQHDLSHVAKQWQESRKCCLSNTLWTMQEAWGHAWGSCGCGFLPAS
jgi:hypothetical protein